MTKQALIKLLNERAEACRRVARNLTNENDRKSMLAKASGYAGAAQLAKELDDGSE